VKIVAPISNIKEAEMLLHYGADELYCGVSTPEWEEHFGGQWWMNRRSPFGANIITWQSLSKIVELAHANDVPVSVTLNNSYYPAGSKKYLLRLAKKMVSELNIDALIVSDIAFLILLREEDIQTKIHLSSVGGCFNSCAVDFFTSLGVQRIILPRQLRISEIESIVTKKSDEVEFEVFALNDGCFYEEGFCQTTHAFDTPFCLINWQIEFCNHSDVIEGMVVDEQLKELQEYLWYLNNCGCTFQKNGLPNGPCSLCLFGFFRDWGVKAVKIVGREASFYRKMRSLQLVKAVIDRTREGAATDEIREFARSLRETPEYCEKGYMCYFK